MSKSIERRSLAGTREPRRRQSRGGAQVDVRAQPLPGRRIPVYPATLRQAEVSGIVRATWVVDTTGRADMSTVRILERSHDYFVAAVRVSLPAVRFAPAMRGGAKVTAHYEEVFRFAGVGGSVYSGVAPLLRRDSTADGIPRMVIGWAEPDSSGAAAIDPADVRAAQRAALGEVTKEGGRWTAACVVTGRMAS